MKRLSFFRAHILHLLILSGVFVYLAYSLISDVHTRDYDLVTIDTISIAGIIIIIIYGLFQRSVTSWCVAEVNSSRIITYTLF